MLKIRLQRVGRKNEPTFRLVVTDSKNGPKSGKSLEVVGSYDPRRENDIKQFNVDRIKYWMGKGVKLSDTVHNFLVSKKVLSGKKINALPKKKPIVKEGEAAAAAPAAAPAAAEEAPKA
jgi:small subunit ribosomal protein S16